MTKVSQPTDPDLRVQAQRERILCAAHECFVNNGFHSASMATIAETASMSPGLIYRYFDGKGDIILAIIERQLDISLGKIQAFRDITDLADGIARHFDEKTQLDPNSISSPLYLEMSAEARRDPRIAAALEQFDSAIRAELADWLVRNTNIPESDETPAIMQERAMMLLCLIDGLCVRTSRQPDLDQKVLRRTIDLIIKALAGNPTIPPD